MYVYILMNKEISNIIYTYLYVHCVGGIVPFFNPSGILVFSEDSVQRINLTLLNNDTLKVHTYIQLCMHVNLCKPSIRLRMSTLSNYMSVEILH